MPLPLGRALADVAPDHAEKMARGLKLFKNGVGQMLKQHCVKCHGGEKTRGDFDLTTREALLKGGSEGTAIVPGNANASRLLELVSHKEKPFMPAKAEKLPSRNRVAKAQNVARPHAETKKERKGADKSGRQWARAGGSGGGVPLEESKKQELH